MLMRGVEKATVLGVSRWTLHHGQGIRHNAAPKICGCITDCAAGICNYLGGQ